MLTRKQYELLMFINRRLNETGVSPSFDEMKEALDLKSKSGIHRLITSLEERGFLKRLAHKARALQVLKLPDAVAIYPQAVAGTESRRSAPGLREADAGTGFTPQVISGGLRPGLTGAAVTAQEVSAITLPLYGRIAAGTPIEAIQNRSHTVHVPPEMLSTGDHYALEVKGDSMIEAGILEGDLALIKKADVADTGDIVVALVDSEEATLKRLRKKGASIALEAANPAYETRIFGPDRVQIQGKLVGLYRRY